MFPRPPCIGANLGTKGGNTGDVGTGAAQRRFHGRGTGDAVGTQRGRLGVDSPVALRRAAL